MTWAKQNHLYQFGMPKQIREADSMTNVGLRCTAVSAAAVLVLPDA
jgi:hypothetical protein